MVGLDRKKPRDSVGRLPIDTVCGRPECSLFLPSVRHTNRTGFVHFGPSFSPHFRSHRTISYVDSGDRLEFWGTWLSDRHQNRSDGLPVSKEPLRMKPLQPSRVVELDYNPSTLSFWMTYGGETSLVHARRTLPAM